MTSVVLSSATTYELFLCFLSRLAKSPYVLDRPTSLLPQAGSRTKDILFFFEWVRQVLVRLLGLLGVSLVPLAPINQASATILLIGRIVFVHGPLSFSLSTLHLPRPL